MQMTPELSKRLSGLRQWTVDDWKRHWDKVEQRRKDAIALVMELIQIEEQTCNEFHSIVHKQRFRLHRRNGKVR
jgi:hypothetical protein